METLSADQMALLSKMLHRAYDHCGPGLLDLVMYGALRDLIVGLPPAAGGYVIMPLREYERELATPTEFYGTHQCRCGVITLASKTEGNLPGGHCTGCGSRFEML